MLPPKQYFTLIKTYNDWRNAEISDMGYKLFGASFPSTWKAHKRAHKLAARQQKG